MEIEQYIVSTDQQLVERALDGDTVAFEHLFNRYRDSIYQLYIQRTSGRTDDASDLLQETFVKVYLNMQRYDSRYTFGQWVYTIARNTFIDYMRRKRDDTVPIDRIGERVSSSWGGPTPEERMITDQSRARLESFLEKMSPRYRELIELRFFKEYSYEEIAAKLQLPMGTVKTQIHRAREQLCRFITESGSR
ncbi:MAG: RNA polymerase sigma factor [Alistipes sp.]